MHQEKKLIILISCSSDEALNLAFRESLRYANSKSAKVEFLINKDNFTDRSISENKLLSSTPGALLLSGIEIAAIERGLITGINNEYKTVTFLSGIGRVTEEILRDSDCIFVYERGDQRSSAPDHGCTIVTSLFKSDRYILGFLRNISALLGYESCVEHIFSVSQLSEFEVTALLEFMRRNSNVLVQKYHRDPGLYNCWNRAIKIAETDYISNANVDDLRHPRHIVELLSILESNPHISVAATALVPFYEHPPEGVLPPTTEVWYSDQAGVFNFTALARLRGNPESEFEPHNIPHCMPVWRRSLHSSYGFFDEGRYGTYADWAFWLKVLSDGNYGWLGAEPLGYYFWNATSHNRIGDNLRELHRSVEQDFIERFSGVEPTRVAMKRNHETYERKLKLTGFGSDYGQHRNNYNFVVAALQPLATSDGPVRFVPFMERQFVWGDNEEDGEAASRSPRPIREPWVGIVHVPFYSPDWFEKRLSPRSYLSSPLFLSSLPACRGLITFCKDLERDLNYFCPKIKTASFFHPTEVRVSTWSYSEFKSFPRLVQAGDWLRRLRAIHEVVAPDYRKTMLLKQHTRRYWRWENQIHGELIDPGVEIIEFVSNEDYDYLLRSSVVLCLLYATAANNLVIECIARATPMIVSPLPAVVEYLGESYPLYAEDSSQASELINRIELIETAHKYLLQRRRDLDLRYEHFCHRVATSGFYQEL